MTADAGCWSMYERLASQDPERLPDAARRLVAYGGLRTEVNNGGFHQYFLNSAGDLAAVALEAADDVGPPELADLVRRAMRELGTGPFPLRRDRRHTRMESIGAERFEELDAEFYAIEIAYDLDHAMDLIAGQS
jgi:hypothetical protein